MRLMRRVVRDFRVSLVLGSVAAVVGCAQMQTANRTVEGWIAGGTPTPRPMSQGKPAAPRIYYADIDGLKVYREPSVSSLVVGQFSLHQKVTRTKVQNGYAYVEGADGVSGWVNNAQLIARLPVAPGAATAPAAVTPETSQEAAPEEPAAAPSAEP